MAREFHKAVWSHPKRDYAAGKDAVGPMVGRLAEAGFEPTVEPELHTIEGLVDAIMERETNTESER